jgi:hypothetical protein
MSEQDEGSRDSKTEFRDDDNSMMQIQHQSSTGAQVQHGGYDRIDSAHPQK